jgi:P-type Ca2+ transporter type 2C
MKINNEQYLPRGLSEQEIPGLIRRYGRNIIKAKRSGKFLHILRDLVLEPMFIILVIAASLYFILGQSSEGWMMISGIIFISAISVYQNIRSSKAIEALNQLTEPRSVVIRDGIERPILSEGLVPGDIIVLEEGRKVPADAVLIRANDLSVDESIITGESLPVEKYSGNGTDLLFQSTIINSGKCIARVTATGNNTALGKIGRSIHNYVPGKTRLQQQIEKFVRQLALFGVIAFLIIWLVNYLNSGDVISSLLFGLTLAMASIPEEIPVAFSSFMALGAYRMSRLGIISRQPKTIEDLGAVTVMCLDKTGTITENKMKLRSIYDFNKNELYDNDHNKIPEENELLKYAVLASERDPFDAMEKAISEAFFQNTKNNYVASIPMIHEYPLEGRPPMMTHVYAGDGKKIVAAKGGLERMVKVCKLQPVDAERIFHIGGEMAAKGFRVLGVASAEHIAGELPLSQDDFEWKFEGLLALYDPPKQNAREVFQQLYQAHIRIKMITGDLPATAINIAQQVGMGSNLQHLTGEQVMSMNDDELRIAVIKTTIYARMFPEAKLKVINALKANGEVVAMTGDGVNDAPALQSSHIGIAMGKHGTEMARQSADLILTDDNIEKIIVAIAHGRRIFNNIKKAFRYIISIHIPVILTASLPVLLGWKYPNIFSPIHVIFLELIMTPTCSVFYEREPVEDNIMIQEPVKRRSALFSRAEIFISIIQGCIIALGVLLLYHIYMADGHSPEKIRTVVFTTLLMSNVFLTFTNRSFSKNFWQTLHYKNPLALPVLLLSVLFIIIILAADPVRSVFEMSSIGMYDLSICFGVSVFSVFWFEAYKRFRRYFSRQTIGLNNAA